MPARLCPHCDVMSNFSSGHTVHTRWGEPSNKLDVQVSTWSCQNCGGILLIFSKFIDTGEWGEWKTYPASIPKVDKSVPSKVAADFISAVNCEAIGEYKPAATMFRRSLQQVMLDKKASGANLVNQIDDLSKNGIITPELKEWAHEIRLWGNEGAHPSKDGLDVMSPEELREVRNFLEHMFEYIYIMPAKLTASRASRINRNQNS